MSELNEELSKRDWLKEVGLGAVGLAFAVLLAWRIPNNLIYCGVAVALTFNTIFFMNRQLPCKAERSESSHPKDMAFYMRSSMLAGIRKQYRYYALVSDLVLIYFIVDHFFI